jgi:BirA family biotin operon repressor/biotin-[acetyl-CoA-carboxylase] ligase
MRTGAFEEAAVPAWELHPARLLGLCRTERLARRIIYFDCIGSTNAAAMAAGADGAPEGTLFIAGQQTSGMGRKGRSWFSTREGSLTVSLLLRPPKREEGLTAILALAVVRSLESFVRPLAIKWPNDVFLKGKKLGGILAESKEDAVVVGLGLNVNEAAGDFPRDITGEAISMRMAAGEVFDRGRVLCRVLESFETLYDGFRRGGFAPLRSGVEERLLYVGRSVAIESSGETFEGRMAGITDEGHLRLDTGGRERVFSSGDLTLRRGVRRT